MVSDQDSDTATETRTGAGAGADTDSAASTITRDKSTIRFPYGDLDQALSVVDAISRFGVTAEPSQVASALDVAGDSAYRLRLLTAQTFGFVEAQRGGDVSLTDLGLRALDPAQRDAVKVEAFLAVPLYAKLYTMFSGTALPATDSAMDGVIANAGVARKSASKARQAFNRSAEQAGFFRIGGRGKLVKPPLTPTLSAGPETVEPTPVTTPPAPEREANVLNDPVLAGLFRRMLPPEGEPFSAKDRKRFFRALAVNLDVIYGEPTDGALDPEDFAKLYRLDSEKTPGR